MNTSDIAISALPAAVTGLFGYLAARLQFRRRPRDASDTIATAFSRLVTELQAENARHLASIRMLREDANKTRDHLARLQSCAETLFRHIAVLEGQIIGLGAVPVARPKPAEAA